MVDIDESYSSFGSLELMVFAIGGQIHICALGDRFGDELGAGTAAQGYRLNRLLSRTL